MPHRHPAGHDAAPVVPGEDGALDAERIQQRGQVVGEMLKVVGLDRLGRVAAPRNRADPARSRESWPRRGPEAGDATNRQAPESRGRAPSLVPGPSLAPGA